VGSIDGEGEAEKGYLIRTRIRLEEPSSEGPCTSRSLWMKRNKDGRAMERQSEKDNPEGTAIRYPY